MKTLSLEVSKRLRVHLENVECGYWIIEFIDDCGNFMGTSITTSWDAWEHWAFNRTYYKTLNLEEAIEFLPSWTRIIIDIQSDWLKQYIWNNIEWVFNNVNFYPLILTYLLAPIFYPQTWLR